MKSPPLFTFCIVPTAFMKSKLVTLPSLGLTALKKPKKLYHILIQKLDIL